MDGSRPTGKMPLTRSALMSMSWDLNEEEKEGVSIRIPVASTRGHSTEKREAEASRG